MPTNEDGSKLVPPETSVTLLAFTTGEALLTSGARLGSCSACASAFVSETLLAVLAPAKRRRPPLPCTSSTFVPRLWMRDWTALEEPLPTAIRTITEATPIVMPRIVRPERSLFAVMPPQAMRSVSRPIIGGPRRRAWWADFCSCSAGGGVVHAGRCGGPRSRARR